jgi:hypothetical protein
MASCEKCWSDAYFKSRYSGKDQAECYSELIKKRENDPCTPEEQAGEDAEICPECNSKTIHQILHICMNPDCKLYYKDTRVIK